MNATYEKSKNTRYSARNMTKPVNFYFAAPAAKSVYLSGDFNDWNQTSHPMLRREDGWWFLQVPLTHGHHLYHFIVDGKRRLDPHGTGVIPNDQGEAASIIAVS